MKITHCLLVATMLALPSAALAQSTPTKDPPAKQAETKQHIEVKGYVLPIVAGIESAQMSAAALHQLATAEPLGRQDVRRTAELADQAVRIAQARADELRKLKGLSAEARPEAEATASKLKAARASVKEIQRQSDAAQVRDASARLHAQLADAHRSIERLAGMYKVSIDLSKMPATPATPEEAPEGDQE